MKRFVLAAVATVAMLFVSTGLLGVVPAFAQTPTPTPGTKMTGPFAGLQGVPPDQRFDHFRGGQMTYADAQGTVHTLTMTAGTVSSITGNSIAITPNGQNSTTTFNITQNTVVHAMPDRGSLTALKSGDKVLVLTDSTGGTSQSGNQDAAMILKANMMGRMGGYHDGWGMSGARSGK